MIILTRGAKNADVAVIGKRRTEFGNNQRNTGRFTNGVFFADEDIERLAWGGFAKPWFQIVEQLRDGLDAAEINEFGLGQETRDAGKIKLIPYRTKTKVASELDERVDGGFNGGLSIGL